MRRVAFLAAAIFFLVGGHARADCLSSGWTVIKPTVNPNQLYTINNPANNVVYDFQNTRIFAKADDMMIKTSGAGNICITHAFVESNVSRTMPYWDIKSVLHLDFAGIAFMNPVVGDHIIEYSIVKNNEDSWYFPRNPVATPDGARMIVRHSLVAYGRDDILEDDSCAPSMTMDNVLVDNGHQGFSNRPGAGYKHSQDHKLVTWNISDSAFYLGCKPDTRDKNASSCPPQNGVKTGQGAYFKSGCRMKAVIKNTIFRLDYIPERGTGSGTLDFPVGEGSTYDNVTLIWRGPGAYPGVLPAKGVTVTNSLTSWTNFRNAWKIAHGCTDNAAGDEFTGCTWHAVNDPLPPDVSTIALASDRINITETQPNDFAGNEFRGSANANATWDTATAIGSLTTNNFLLLADIPSDYLIVFVKEKDAAGQYSQNAISLELNETAPPDPTSITEQSTNVTCVATKPADFLGFQFRTGLVPDAAWASLADFATPRAVCGVQKSGLPVGTQRVCVKEVDKGGLQSVNAACLNLNISDPPPADITSISLTVDRVSVVETRPDDFQGNEFRGSADPAATWDTATKIGSVTTNNFLLFTAIPTDTLVVLAKMVDKSGQYSVNPVSHSVNFAAPPDISSLTHPTGFIKCVLPTQPKDVAGFQFRTGTVSGAAWATLADLGSTRTACQATEGELPGSTQRVCAKEVDTGGLQSANAACIDVSIVTNPVPPDVTSISVASDRVNITETPPGDFAGNAFRGSDDPAATWDTATAIGSTTTNTFLLFSVIPAADVIVFAKMVDSIGQVSVNPVSAVINLAPPPDVTRVTHPTGNIGCILPTQPKDLSGYQFRAGPTAGAIWDALTNVGGVRGSCSLADNLIPANTRRMCVKEVDTGGLSSVNAACIDLAPDDPPPAVASVSANATTQLITWVPPTSQAADFFGYYPRAGTGLSATWDDMVDIGSPRTVAYTGTTLAFGLLPAGALKFCVKELDNAKQESDNAVCVNVPVDSLPPDPTGIGDIGDRILWTATIPPDFQGFEVATAPDSVTPPLWAQMTVLPGLRDALHNYITKVELGMPNAGWIGVKEVDQANQRSANGIIFHKLPDIVSPCVPGEMQIRSLLPCPYKH